MRKVYSTNGIADQALNNFFHKVCEPKTFADFLITSGSLRKAPIFQKVLLQPF